MHRGPTFQDYYIAIDRMVRDRLEQERVEYLLGVDPDEYLDYLVSEAEWGSLEWHEDLETIEPITVGHAQALRLRLPITPHPQLQEYLRLGPSTYRLVREPSWKVENDTLVIDVEPSMQAAERALDDVRFWLGGRNRDIDSGNKTLRERIERGETTVQASSEAQDPGGGAGWWTPVALAWAGCRLPWRCSSTAGVTCAAR